MKIYPNQRIITIDNSANTDNETISFSKSALELARQNLTPMAFEVWSYLASHNDGECFPLSSSDLRRKCRNTDEYTYLRNFKKLVDAGYLHHGEENNYTFSDLPKYDIARP